MARSFAVARRKGGDARGRRAGARVRCARTAGTRRAPFPGGAPLHGGDGAARPRPDATPLRANHLHVRAALPGQLLHERMRVLRVRLRPGPAQAPPRAPGGGGGTGGAEGDGVRGGSSAHRGAHLPCRLRLPSRMRLAGGADVPRRRGRGLSHDHPRVRPPGGSGMFRRDAVPGDVRSAPVRPAPPVGPEEGLPGPAGCAGPRHGSGDPDRRPGGSPRPVGSGLRRRLPPAARGPSAAESLEVGDHAFLPPPAAPGGEFLGDVPRRRGVDWRGWCSRSGSFSRMSRSCSRRGNGRNSGTAWPGSASRR